MTRVCYFLLLLVLVVLAGCGGGTTETASSVTQGTDVAESVSNVQTPMNAVSQSIDEANRALASLALPVTQSQSVARIAAVRAAVRRGGEQHAEVKIQLERLAALSESIEKEKSRLAKANADLERRTSRQARGIYVSLAGAAVLLLIYLLNRPLRKAELDLKRLEIKKKELEIRELESRHD